MSNYKVYVLFFLILASPSILETFSESKTAQNTNPLSNPNQFTFFPDDEVIALTINRNDPKDGTVVLYDFADSSLHGADTKNKSEVEWTLSNFIDTDNWGKGTIRMASGRITEATRDQIVGAYYNADGSLHVRLLSNDTMLSSTTLSGRINESVVSKDFSVFDRFDIAVGDIDGLIDKNGFYHDEIIISSYCFKDPNIKQIALQVTVLDSNLQELYSWEKVTYAGRIAMDLGDIDDDGILEITLIQAVQKGAQTKNTVTYILEKESAFDQTYELELPLSHYADITAGSYRGLSRDDIAVIYIDEDQNAIIQLISLDSKSGTLTKNEKKMINDSKNSVLTVSIDSGLFQFQPSNNLTIHHKQILASYQSGTASCVWRALCLCTPSNSLDSIDIERAGDNGSLDWSNGHYHENPQMVIPTGLFGKQSDSPSIQAASLYMDAITDWTYAWCVGFLALENHADSFNESMHVFKNRSDSTTCVDYVNCIASCDIDGDSLYLGAPAHVVIHNLHEVISIIQSPPKHIDYLPDSNGEWATRNISVEDDYYVKMEDHEQNAVKTTTQSKTSFNIGGSAKLSFTTKEDLWFGSDTSQFAFKASYDYNSRKEQWESNYKTCGRDEIAIARSDDHLHVYTKQINIWSYPMYGLKTDNHPQGYLQYTIPDSNPHELFGGGLGHLDFYNPDHIPINMLSYPEYDNESPNSLALDDQNNPILCIGKNTVYDIMSGAADVLSLSWVSENEKKKSFEYSHTIGASFDFKNTTSTDLIIAKQKSTTEINLHSQNNWTRSKISDVKTTQSRGITLSMPEGSGLNSIWSYSINPCVYLDRNKVLRVSHEVVSPDSNVWWENHYGKKPDPSLLLPFRFDTVYITEQKYSYALQTDFDTRTQMRGLRLYKEGENIELSTAIYDGDCVDVGVRCGNFSLYSQKPSFDLLLEYIPFDTINNTEFGQRKSIGTVRVNNLGAREIREVTVPWNTTGLGGSIEGSAQYYRLYVTIDPKNEVDEIHEWKDADGNRLDHGNNEGHWPSTNGCAIYYPQTGKNTGNTTKSTNLLTRFAFQIVHDSSMHDESLSIKIDGKIVSDDDRNVYMGKQYAIRCNLHSTHYLASHHMLIFEEKYNNEDDWSVWGSCLLRGVSQNNNYVWRYWKPKHPGRCVIRAHFLEHPEDAERGNTKDTIIINIMPPESPVSVKNWELHSNDSMR